MLLLALATVLAPPPPTFAARRAIPLTDLNPYGANFFLEREVEAWKRERTVTMARAAGIAWARQEFPWEEIEPQPGEYHWSKYDDIVALYARQNLHVIARLDRPPLWARGNASGTGSSGPPDDFETYGAFVEAFARRYRGKIFYLQIWNEPNLAREWNDGPIDPAAYTNLLKIAHTRAKGVDPNIRILSAPLAITLGELYAPGTNLYRNMNDLQFLEEMYMADAKDYFDILSANAFGLGSPPDDPPNPGKLNFQRVVLERAVMEQFGDAAKSIWILEYGWNAAPTSIPDSRLIWGRVTEEQQAEYTVRGIEYARKNWEWAGVVSIWYFRQVGDILIGNPEYFFRMVDADFTPRPVYVRVAQTAGKSQTAGPGRYEETNPALAYNGAWAPNFDARASAGQESLSEQDGARITLRFLGEAVELVAHKYPGAGRFYATLDGQPLTALPRDASGKSYVELDDTSARWQAVIPIVSRLGRQEHALELTTRGKTNLDGFAIAPLAPQQPPWLLIGLLGLLGVGGGVLFWREVKT